jgi:hypothetical protein
MKSWIIALSTVICLSCFSGCNTFEGIAGDTGETYTTTYNTPGLRVVPYNDQNVDVNEPVQEIEICEGLVKGDGIPKCDR